MLSENIKEFRKRKSLSQEELALELHVVRQTISKWEKGLSVPDALQLIELANTLEVSVGELLDVKIQNEKDTKEIAEQLERANEQIAELLKNLIPHLEEGGRIILGYLYRTNEFSIYCKEWDDIYNIERIKSIDPNIELKTFRGVKGVLHDMDSMKDAVYVYQKKK